MTVGDIRQRGVVAIFDVAVRKVGRHGAVGRNIRMVTFVEPSIQYENWNIARASAVIPGTGRINELEMVVVARRIIDIKEQVQWIVGERAVDWTLFGNDVQSVEANRSDSAISSKCVPY